jgi:cytochrome c-type biogenesis protein CcmH/NrfG
MEALAVTYAKMQDYPKASGLLVQLVAARPDYGDAWRLLGEASLLSGEAGRSVTAYEKALELAPGSQTVLTVRRRGWERRSSAIGICICSRRPHAT